MIFFSAKFQVLGWSFLVLHFRANVCNWIPKVIWPQMDSFWGFYWKMASVPDFRSVWSKICKECSIVILFWRYKISSMFSLRVILVCSLKMLLLFSRRILYYRLITFENAKQLYFLSFVFSILFFLEVVVKIFDYLWKSNSLFFKFCVDCLLMFYFV